MERCGVRVVTRDVILQPDLPGVGLRPRDHLPVSPYGPWHAVLQFPSCTPRRVEPTAQYGEYTKLVGKEIPEGRGQRRVQLRDGKPGHQSWFAWMLSGRAGCQSSAGLGHGMEFRTIGHTLDFLLRPPEATNRKLANCHPEVLQCKRLSLSA
jgi:hypothetical protein